MCRLSRAAVVFFALVLSISVAKISYCGTNKWTSLGPGGASVFELAVAPGSPSTIYASAYSRVYKSSDGGASWVQGGAFGFTNLRAIHLAVSPKNPDTVFAAVDYSRGVLKSVDGGASWQYFTLGLSVPLTALAVEPNYPEIVLGSSGDGIHRSEDGGATWARPATGRISTYSLTCDSGAQAACYAGTWQGVYRSTDTGLTWTPINAGMQQTTVYHLAVASNGTTIYAGAEKDVFHSTDGGASWHPSRTGLRLERIMGLGLDSGSADIVYACTTGGGILRSTDGGVTWSQSNSGIIVPSGRALVAAPGLPGVVYALAPGGFYRSTDAGVTWSWSSRGLSGLGISTFTTPQAAPGTFYAGVAEGDFGFDRYFGLGVFKSTGAGLNWSPASAGLTDLSVFALATDPRSPDIVFAGTGKGVFKSTDGAATWSSASAGIGEARILSLAIDSDNPDSIYAGTAGGLFRSTDGGDTWLRITEGIGTRAVRAIAPAPQLAGTIYVGADNRVLKSIDGGENWLDVTSGITLPALEKIEALAVAPYSPETVIVGSRSGIFRSTDGGATWLESDEGRSLSCAGAFVFDSNAPGHVYSTYCGGGVRKSIDGGATWFHFNSGSMAYSNPPATLAMDSATPPTLYAGGFGGLHEYRYGPSLVADFSMNPLTGNAPLTVSFTNSSKGYLTGVLWDFGDGQTSGLYAPKHVYQIPGTYDVSLTVANSEDTSTHVQSITVLIPRPVPRFSVSRRSGFIPFEVSFTNDSTGNITGFEWDFGDGQTSTEKNPAHIFRKQGRYKVTLKATGPGGSAIAARYIDALVAPPKAGFTAAPVAGVAPLKVSFATTSTGRITSYSWDFGDGYVSAGKSAVHTYTTPGIHTVTHSVTGPGGTRSGSRAIIVRERNPVWVKALDAIAFEGARPEKGAFVISRAGSTLFPLTVHYRLAGTARSGADYGRLPLQAVFPKGSSQVRIDVTPINDFAMETNETVTLTLQDDPNYVTRAPRSATITIRDDEM